MNIIKKTLGFIAPIKNKLMALMAFCMVTACAFAEGESEPTNEVKTLWDKLQIDLSGFFEKVFQALSQPVGVVLAVIFVMCIFYLVVRLASKSINPTKRVG